MGAGTSEWPMAKTNDYNEAYERIMEARKQASGLVNSRVELTIIQSNGPSHIRTLGWMTMKLTPSVLDHSLVRLLIRLHH